MSISGLLVEIGELEKSGRAIGIVIKTADGSFITVTGLTFAQCREWADMFGDKCVLKVEPA